MYIPWISVLLLSTTFGEVTPHPELCSLHLGESKLAPLAVVAGESKEEVVGGRAFRFESGAVTLLDPAQPNATQRSFALADGRVWALSPDAHVAYFTAGGAPIAQLLRLDLEKGEWLEPWTIDGTALGADAASATTLQIDDVLPEADGVFVVCALHALGPTRAIIRPSRYLVARLCGPNGNATWTRTFELGEGPPGPRAVLMAPRRNGPMQHDLRALQRVGAALLVCFGGESLMSLTVEAGETRWTVDRPWELERGFVGPSVWQHFVGRFGVDTLGSLDSAATLDSRRDAFDLLQTGSIVAGPFVVESPGSLASPQRLLLVTARTPRDGFGELCVQQYVHEFGIDGTPCSVVALPRAFVGPSIAAGSDRIAFACARGTFACVASSENDGRLGAAFPGSGPDCVGRMVWLIDATPSADAPWLAGTSTRDVVAASEHEFLRLHDEGRIRTADAHEFVFPMSLVRARDGAVRGLELRVPFDGAAEQPRSNYANDGTTNRVWGPLAITVTRLRFVGRTLEVTLATAQSVSTVSFDATKLSE